ncbi:hypothetical protein ACIQAC_25645 [Streptomyces sp. NPDC088387]|uniref:hypothetical protein n=1 Tax=Streptomyces sp. NPDC088387 TaxID=3365859 RepID=UPI00380B61E0
MPADEVARGTEANVSRVRTGPRHAAPKKPLFTRIQVPAGKAIALAAMPTAVLMGMGFTPRLALADDSTPSVSNSLTADEYKDCVEALAEAPSGSPSPSASESGDTTDKTDKGDQDGQGEAAEPTPSVSSPAADSSPAPGSSGSSDGDSSSDSGSDDEDASTPEPPPAEGSGDQDTVSPTPTPSRDGGLLGTIGDAIDGVVDGVVDGITGGGADGTATPTPSATGDDEAASPDDKKTDEKDNAKADEKDGTSGDDSTDAADEPAGEPTAEPTEPSEEPSEPSEEPSGEATASPSPSVSPSESATVDPDGCPIATDAESGIDNKVLVPDNPWYLDASSLLLKGADYQGVVEVKTASGTTKKVLKYVISDGTDIGDLHQTVKDEQSGKTHHVQAAGGSTSTIRDGKTVMYTESISGNLLGLIPVTFDPEHPPPLNIPLIYFTKVKVTQAGQFGGTLTVPGLHQFVTD